MLTSGEITKVKGFKNHVKYKQLKSLLSKNNSLLLDQENDLETLRRVILQLKNNCIHYYQLKINDN